MDIYLIWKIMKEKWEKYISNIVNSFFFWTEFSWDLFYKSDFFFGFI